MKELVTKYPTVQTAWDNWNGVLKNFNMHEAATFEGWHEDPNEISDSLPAEFTSEEAEEATNLISAGWDHLVVAVRQATGLKLCCLYVSDPEDSYWDVSNEWVYYVENAWKPRELTDEARASGLTISSVSWTRYG